MSCMRCDSCQEIIDTDDDPECFVEVPWLNMADHVWCEPCRDREFEEHEREADRAEMFADKAAAP